ncbi:MAG: SpoIIE family protein phosphatase [bacterium]|nr:SpoIIE family protein phosphatase [bacterium]
MDEKKRKIKFSLGIKFSLFISLLVIMVIAILGYILINLQTQQLVNETLRRGGFLARSLSRVSLEKYLIGENFDIIVYCHSLSQEEGVVEAFFINKFGEIIAHSDSSKITPQVKAKKPKYKKGKKVVEPEKVENEYNNDFFFKGKDLNQDAFGYQLYKEGQFYDIYSTVKMGDKFIGMAHVIISRLLIFKMVNEAIMRIIYISGFVLILGVIGALLLSKIVIKPVKKLTEGVTIIGTGNLEHQIVLKARDEMGYLAESFNNMTVRLKEAQKAMLEKEKLEREMQIASTIQQTLLPKKFPEFKNIEYGAFYKATKSVGGDYYDLIRISDNKLGIIAADVSGKGVPGSLVMSMFRSIIRSNIHPDLNSFDTLSRTNALIVPDIIEEMFVTAFYGVYNLTTSILDFCIAGHNPLIVFNSMTKVFNFVNAEAGIPVGLQDNTVFQDMLKRYELKINRNDMIIQYTDGITEAMDIEKKLFGEERFHDSIKRNGVLPPAQFIEKLLKDVTEFTKGAPQNDDRTVVVVKLI